MDSEINYAAYKLNRSEKIKFAIFIIFVCGIFSYLFYGTFYPTILFLLPVKFYYKYISKILNEKRKNELTLQFREFCLSMCTQLMAGYSIENAIFEIYREMEQLFGKNSYICKELKVIHAKLRIGEKVEAGFEDFANRSCIEEIKLFSEVLNIAKRSGGDIIEIVRNSANSIGQKIEVEREIRMIINSKKHEQTIMNFIPLIMILYVNITSPNMMRVMYVTVFGRIIMTVCLLAYVLGVWLGEVMSDIKM